MDSILKFKEIRCEKLNSGSASSLIVEENTHSWKWISKVRGLINCRARTRTQIFLVFSDISTTWNNMHKNSDYLLSLRINKNTQAIIKRLNYSCKHFYLLLTFQLQTLQKAQQHSDHWCQPSPPSSQSPELLMYCQYYVELAGKHCFLHLKFRLYLEQFSPLFQYFLWQKWHFRLWLWQCCLHQLYLEEETFLQLHWSFCSLIDTCFRNNKHISKYFINSYPKFKRRSGGGG